MELNEQVLKIAERYLRPGGQLMSKIFDGADFFGFYRHFKKLFMSSHVYKPEASRDRSRERFVIGKNFIKK